MKTGKTFIGIVTLTAISLLQTGCVNCVTIYQQKDFNNSNMDSIAVTPLLDGRRQILTNVEYENKTAKSQDKIIRTLKNRKYNAIALSDPSVVDRITPTQVPFLNAEQIRQLNPGTTKWVFVTVVDEMSPLSNSNHCEITCYLYDTEQGKLVWEGTAWKNNNIDWAIGDVLSEFPRNK
jgi:hypothetical protein